MQTRIVVIFLMVFALFAPSLMAKTTPEQILAMVRDIDLPGKTPNSLAIDMRMRLPGTPVNILCLLRYCAPQTYSLQVFDGNDGTPLLIVVNKLALINDPLAETLSLIASAGVVFDLAPQGDQYTANFAFTMPADGETKNKIRLDFKTMFSRLIENVEVTTDNDGCLNFSGTTKEKSRCTSVFDASATMPLRSLRLFVENVDEPVIEFSRLEADYQDAAAVTAFPEAELQKSGVATLRTAPDGFLDTMVVMTSIVKAVFARSAIYNPEMREEIEKMLAMKIDWQTISKRDAERSSVLRKVFPEGLAR